MNTALASKKLARELKLIRQRKISKLRAQIEKGRYHIDNKTLARSLFLAR